MPLPSLIYQQHLAQGLLKEDPLQAHAITVFDTLYQQLTERRWFHFSAIKGIYLWGDVGRGKTYLMDLFFDALPITKKYRVHFHAFMRDIHDALHEEQGHSNPLSRIAKKYAKKTRVLCLDEFIVNDITDAMVLGELLTCLLKEGVCIVTTSNTVPQKLYWNGLQRERFLPAITLLLEYTHIVELNSAVDYRLHHFMNDGVYFYPLNEVADHRMQTAFTRFSHPPREEDAILHIEGRDIPVIAKSSNAVWFEFKTLCGIPRSQRDYLALTEIFDTVLISHMPILHANDHDLVNNFIRLVDVLYDAHTTLIMCADAPIAELYTQGRFVETFKRTQSRLAEMQSAEYLKN